MFLSDNSVKRPIAMLCMIIVIVLFGLSSYKKLGLSVMPEIDIPFVTITTVYPGADPEVIEVDVAKRIEDAVSKIDGLKHLSSTCMENICINVLEFNLDVDVDIAAVDVREKINLILNDFPSDVEEPKILKFDINSLPVVTLLITGDIPLDALYDYVEDKLSDKFSIISGVAEINVSGGENLELHVILDPAKLASTNLTVADVIAKLKTNNIKIPCGRIKEGKREFNVTMDAEMKDISEFENMEIDSDPLKRIYLRDLGEIKMLSEENRSKAFYNGKPAISMKIIKKGEANSVELVNNVKKKLKEIIAERSLPGGIQINWFVDEGDFTKASMNDAWNSVFLGIILTAIILFVFLHEIRSTLIVVITIPVSIVATFGVMRIFGYTLSNPTLLALGTSIGTLVTNSIVVIEDIFAKLEEGMSPIDAAKKGTAQVALPVFASAMTNVIVFVPIAMMPSIIGKYFAPFAITMTAATLVSLLTSFTLTPILATKFLREKMPKRSKMMSFYIKHWNNFYNWIENYYLTNLNRMGRYPLWAPLLSIVLLAITFIFIAPRVGMSFFPENDKGEFILKLEFPTNSNLQNTIEHTLDIDRQIRGMPEVKETSVVCGKTQGVIGQVSEAVFLSEIYVKTSQKTERKLDLDEMREMFRIFLNKRCGFMSTVNIPSPVGGSSSQMEIEISGDEQNILEKLASDAETILQQSGLMTDVESNVRPGKPELKISLKRSVIEDARANAVSIGEIVRGGIDGINAGTYKVGDRSFDIRVIGKEILNCTHLADMTFSSENGRPLNIETISDLNRDSIPIQIVRAEKTKTVKIYANPRKGVALGNATSFAEKKIAQILPLGYKMRFTGQIERMQEGQSDFLFAIISAILLTYLLIAASLESWTIPLLIMATVPLSLVGMFVALFLTGTSLSMMGLLGFVMLIGIVVNNAILIMDELEIQKRKGLPLKDAILLASKIAFKPIIMTSIAAILGIIPMAFGMGLGSELRASCGIGIVGGLISSTILSLTVIPMGYTLFYCHKNPDTHKL